MTGKPLQGLPSFDVNLVRTPEFPFGTPVNVTLWERRLMSVRLKHSRVEIPNHDNGIVTTAGEPPTRECPSYDENWASVHREGR